jgi:ribose transport system ATP-binding protein
LLAEVKDAGDVVLEARGICKSFGGHQVLTNVDFCLKRGEIHGLLGLNGSGKTTLLNILNGIIKPDSGEILLWGKRIDNLDPQSAKKYGLILCNQVPMLFPNLTVADNIMIGLEPTLRLIKIPLIDRSRIKQIAEEILTRCGFKLPIESVAGNLPQSMQKQVEIAKALAYDAQILCLDEPTNMMTSVDAKRLFDLILSLKQEGKSIIYVTHRISEVFTVCDRITVLRDGKKVGTVNRTDTNMREIVNMISRGSYHDSQRLAANVKRERSAETIIELRNVKTLAEKPGERILENINLRIYKGEVTGVLGVVGAGKTELAKVIAGIKHVKEGEVLVLGQPVSADVVSMIKRGVYYLPEDMMGEGLFPAMSTRENITITGLELNQFINRMGVLKRTEEKRATQHMIKRLDISPKETEFPVQKLSGGNKKKVLIARGLLAQPKVLLLDEPTMGIDISTSADLLSIISKLTEEGVTPIIFSSEFERVLPVLDRAVVLKDGRIVGEVRGEEIKEPVINALVAG